MSHHRRRRRDELLVDFVSIHSAHVWKPGPRVLAVRSSPSLIQASKELLGMTTMTIKDNANPIIHDVSRDASASSWESLFLEDELANHSGDTPANRAIRQALSDCSTTTTTGERRPQEPVRSIIRRAPFPWSTAAAVIVEHHRHQTKPDEKRGRKAENEDNKQTHVEATEKERDPLSADEVFAYICNIQDPEHPLTLEQLGVVSVDQIDVSTPPYIRVRFTPTIPHCSMATLIGLSMTVKLIRSVPTTCKVTVTIEPGTHNSELSINKQLADKERVCAALENKHLLGIVNKCIAEGLKVTTTTSHQ
jgi:metal-sulfur cluster biosynthetic enzyme